MKRVRLEENSNFFLLSYVDCCPLSIGVLQFRLDFGVISDCWCVTQFIIMQFILESILPLFLHLTLSFSRCVVTRGIMGLSYSRQEVDALNSNIK